MPALTDLTVARRILQSDPVWCVYALGDLEPAVAAQCSWFWNPDDPAGLVLLYRGYLPPIFFAMGQPRSVEPLLDEIAGEKVLSLHIRPETLPLVAARYRISEVKSDWRMGIAARDFRPGPLGETVRLGPADIDCLQALYDDGADSGEAPEYFSETSLRDGVFFGVFDQSELIAVAGTHLVSETEQVAAVGNIYTRRSRRGMGLAAKVTSAVVDDLFRRRIRTVALNVRQHNARAIGLYERLGFVKYCEFLEGIASH